MTTGPSDREEWLAEAEQLRGERDRWREQAESWRGEALRLLAEREQRLSRRLRRTAARLARRGWRLLPMRARDVLRPLLSGGAKAPSAPVSAAPRPERPRAARPVARFGSSESPPVSVLIPTLDGGPAFDRLLGSIAAQDRLGEIEVVVADCGSVDGTAEAARSAGARVLTIPREEFGHGRTRNHAAEASEGTILLLLVQDAVLLGRTVIRDLVGELLADERLAAVSARQVPCSDADLYAAFVVYNHDRAIRQAGRRRSSTVDNVCAAIRREAWEEIRFADVPFAEDVDFGVRAVERGWKVGHSVRAAVAHSHTRGPAYQLRRNVADRLYVAPLLGERHVSLAATAEIEQLLPAGRVFFQEVEGAVSATGVADTPLALCLDRIRSALEAGAPRIAPSDGLGEAAALLEAAGGEAREEVVSGLRRTFVSFLDSPPVREFAAAHRHVPAVAAADFAAKAAASAVGRAIGEALRIHPDDALAGRLLSAV